MSILQHGSSGEMLKKHTERDIVLLKSALHRRLGVRERDHRVRLTGRRIRAVIDTRHRRANRKRERRLHMSDAHLVQHNRLSGEGGCGGWDIVRLAILFELLRCLP